MKLKKNLVILSILLKHHLMISYLENRKIGWTLDQICINNYKRRLKIKLWRNYINNEQ